MNRIKELRKERGWTRAELSRRSGVNAQTISSLEHSQSKYPTLPIGIKIARAFGVAPEELLSPNPPPAASSGLISAADRVAVAS